jgi:hypothetical protein
MWKPDTPEARSSSLYSWDVHLKVRPYCLSRAHPIVARIVLEHGVQILNTPQMVAELRGAHLTDQCRRIRCLISVHSEL